MLKRCILAENRKLHASPIWAMFFVLPILSAVYGIVNNLFRQSVIVIELLDLRHIPERACNHRRG